MSADERRGVPYGPIVVVLYCAIAFAVNFLLFLGFKQTLWP
ncbi:MAG TPA: hypothetical protein VFE03_06685 [Caulobacteraceae bacterium]|jgi:hypothetical protein|nr:hypothetical protein [Caulobacteraceae bacterium]